MGKKNRDLRREASQHLPLIDSLSIEVADYFAESALPQVGQCVQAAAVLTKAAALHGIQLEPVATSLIVWDRTTRRAAWYGQRGADFFNEFLKPDDAAPVRSSAPATSRPLRLERSQSF